MARPKSMPDFASLLDASYSPLAGAHEKERPRKKPSISLAAGLIMASESNSTHASPKSMMPPPPRPSSAGRKKGDEAEEWSEGLFYAYAQKSDYAQSPPYILTFSSAAIAQQWWNLVRAEYPESERVGPQLFILKGDDMQEQIQDNPKFYDLRNKWFYAPSEGMAGGAGVIPLQDWRGFPAVAPAKEENVFGMAKLNETLEKMNAMISSNSEQIAALGVAQSAGLQRMQEINESNSTQIKTLTDNQNKLQSLISDNASHYIALSNSSFNNQEQMKGILKTNADQIKALADGQSKLASTCAGLMKTIESLGNSVGKVNESVNHLSLANLDSGSQTGSAVSGQHPPFSSVGNRISPPPRKLNRRIKGVWYEYDTSTSPAPSPRKVGFLDTPPKSPSSTRT